VLAAGVGLPDVLMCRGNYPFTPTLPFTNGQEVCGIVTDCHGNERFRLGQRVMGVTAFIEGHGGFAEQALLYDQNALPVPEEMSDTEAAIFCIAYRTGYVALVTRGQMKAGETLLVETYSIARSTASRLADACSLSDSPAAHGVTPRQRSSP
jgi:NADPH2:quinone reductase